MEDRERILRAVRFCLLGFVGLRVAMFVIGVVGVTLFPPLRAVGVPGWPAPAPDPGWQNAFTAWERFDALWFLRIAESGYRLRDGSAAFFPLYPLAIRGLSFALGGHPFAAATIVSNAAFWGGLVVTYLLTASELSERTARTSVLLMCVFPTAHFFLMPYSEALFFLLSVTAFWGARRRRWAVAGAAGALAALTRSIGIVIAPALVIEALHQRIEGRGRAWPGFLAAAATGSGLLAYLGSWWLRAGEWLAPVTFQANWQRSLSWPWATLWEGTGDAFRYLDDLNGGYWLIDWLIVIPMLAASVYALVRLRPAYGVYLWSALLIPLTYVFPDRPLMSMPRFVLPLFPAFWGLALGLERLRIPRSAA
ncbi:MAG TPA: mannosyltransferase family protein, partial [Actinomycetota bacterium]